MKKIFKHVICMLLAVTAMFCLSMSAFADSDYTITCKKKLDADIVAKWCSSHDDGVLDSTYKCYTVDSSDGEFSIKCTYDTYKDLTPDEKATANKQMTATINSWGLSQEASQDIYNKLKGMEELGISDSTLLTLIFAETKADLSSAMKIFAPFNGTLGVILGIGVIIIIILLITSTVFDLVYLGLPMARVAMDGKAESNNQPKPFGVSYDAVRLVQEFEGGTGGNGGQSGNIYFAYLKRRIITYIVLAICILYLVSGQIAGLIGWLMDLVSGFGN